jgi:hypothetical protein
MEVREEGGKMGQRRGEGGARPPEGKVEGQEEEEGGKRRCSLTQKQKRKKIRDRRKKKYSEKK